MQSIYKKVLLFGIIVFVSVFFFSFSKKTTYNEIGYLESNLTKLNVSFQNLDIATDNFRDERIGLDSLQKVFLNTRRQYKKVEFFLAFYHPEYINSVINGAPLLHIEKENTNPFVVDPEGLQVLDELIFSEEVWDERHEIASIAKKLSTSYMLLYNKIGSKSSNITNDLIAMRLQLVRIFTLGITGFDTPVSQYGIEESKISLQGLLFVYENSIQNIIVDKNPKLDISFKENVTKAIDFLKKEVSFEDFDRYIFIRDFMNPLTRDWVAIRKVSGLWEGMDSNPLNFDAPTFFEDDSFNVVHFTPSVNRNPDQKQIDLGKRLFFDPSISKNGQMACATCHIPEKAYADGLVLNRDNKGEKLKRNTPTLINAVYQKAFFWDGRSATLLDQISSVFTNKKEFDSGVHEFSSEILQDTAYSKLFKEVYGDIAYRNTEVIKAISSYISTLNGFNSKFDRNIRGEENTLTDEEKLGFNLFAGKALCATCHFIPLTNGTVPPFYAETEKEVIGVPETSENKNLDDDLGFYWKYEEKLHRGMFKTPTVRNVSVTSPYMHNGVYKSLEEVVDFYNKGGGAGLGFDLEHQTLPFDNLNLTEEEQNAIVAYMKTLTDVEVEQMY